MAERVLRGAPASPGLATGRARLLALPSEAERARVPDGDPAAEAERARAALAEAGRQLDELAGALRDAGRVAEADIVETGALMAVDPLLDRAVAEGVTERGLSAGCALIEAAGDHAEAIAALPDPTLAARADDVRSLGRRAARIAGGGAPSGALDAAADSGYVLVAEDLGPADVAELADGACAIALAAGAVTAHAAIVARSLGIPMVVELGSGILAVEEGAQVGVDGTAGEAAIDPSPERAGAAAVAAGERQRADATARDESALPAETLDGRRVRVLVNAASAAEVAAGLAAGAEGAGLIRTELAFLDAPAWPSHEDHRRSLAPILEALAGRPATVRVLDYGGDKRPPFLATDERRGIDLLLGHPRALSDQLGAILRAAAAARVELRILLPLVRDVAEVRAVRDLLAGARGRLNGDAPASTQLGAMVELPEAAAAASALAAECEFLSVGTNDLTHTTLGSDRFRSVDAPTHDPRVLRHIAATIDAGRAAGIAVEVCGEAASDPLVAPLLVGMGVDELSVGAARVGEVRAWIRSLEHGRAAAAARAALEAHDADEVARIAEPLRAALSR